MKSKNNKLDLTGYATVRKFAGYALPVPIQNLLLRRYCEEHNFNYRLPLVEIDVPNNYMHLFSTIDRCSISDNIGMCSIYMFPREVEKFISLKKKIDKKKLQFHFIFENCVVSSEELSEFYFNSRLRFL